VPALGRADQRRAVEGVLAREIRAVLHREVEEVDVPLTRSDQERALLRVVLRVDVGSPLDQPTGELDVVLPRRHDQPGVEAGLLAWFGHGGLRGARRRGLAVGLNRCAGDGLGLGLARRRGARGREDASRDYGHDDSSAHVHEGRDASTVHEVVARHPLLEEAAPAPFAG
jgi:hypothetical protein